LVKGTSFLSDDLRRGRHGNLNFGGVATPAKNTTEGANDTQTASLQLSEMAARLQAAVAKFSF
jgi:hypothetical protein